MKALYTLVFMLFSFATLQAQVGLEGIIVEKYYVSNEADSINAAENFATYHLPVGSVTYRVYADLLPDYKVIQMFGSQTHTLSVSTTTSFYNDPNYGFSTYQGTSVINTRKNTTLIDSYLTIGGVASGLLAVPKEEDTDGSIGNLQGVLANADVSAGAPITGTDAKDGLMPGEPVLPNILGLTSELDVFDQTPGSVFQTSGGTIAALGGVAGVTASNHVLLGQFTTDGVFSFVLNIQLATPVQGESQIFVASNPGVGEYTDTTLTYTSPVEEPIAVSELESNSQELFTLYPNPCKEQLFLVQTGGLIGGGSYSVFDSTGREIITSNLTSVSERIDVSALQNGLYTICVRRPDGVAAKKFMKQ